MELVLYIRCTPEERDPLQVKKQGDAGPCSFVGEGQSGEECLGHTQFLSDPQGYILLRFLKISGTAYMAVKFLHTCKISKKNKYII